MSEAEHNHDLRTYAWDCPACQLLMLKRINILRTALLEIRLGRTSDPASHACDALCVDNEHMALKGESFPKTLPTESEHDD